MSDSILAKSTDAVVDALAKATEAMGVDTAAGASRRLLCLVVGRAESAGGRVPAEG